MKGLCYTLKYFLFFVACVFCYCWVSTSRNFKFWSGLYIDFFLSWLIFFSKKSLLHVCGDILVFSSESFIVWPFTCRSVIHVKLIFVSSVRSGSAFIYPFGFAVSATPVKKSFLFPIWSLQWLCQKWFGSMFGLFLDFLFCSVDLLAHTLITPLLWFL